MKYVVLSFCCLMLSACVAQKTQYESLATPVEVIQSMPFQLQDFSQAEKTVSLFATKGGKEEVALEQVMRATLQGSGFSFTESPSQAGYVILIRVVHEGMLTPAQVQAAAQQAHGSGFEGKTAQGQELEESLGLAMVLDVHLAVRKNVKPLRKNPAVVATASTDTIIDESDGRFVVYAQGLPEEDDADGLVAVKKMLVEQAAKTIIQEISSTQP